jgi:1,4-dihydroxy-2-naphthoate octaprenyltransferase
MIIGRFPWSAWLRFWLFCGFEKNLDKEATVNTKIKAHLWTLPRWFGAPFFGAAILLGGLLAGGLTANSWLALLTGLLIMAGGHSFNSYLDYAWTGLDKGDVEERSAEKNYTGGQSLIAKGEVTLRGVLFNAIVWYLLAAVPLLYLTLRVSWVILALGLAGMAITFWYAKAKFNWTHELSLGIGVGPIAVLLGMLATDPNAAWSHGLAASVPFMIVLSFAGLALDEWPDAEANLKKGVKSIAYKVWENGISLEWYLTSWFLFMFCYQLLLIVVGILAPLTAISWVCWPFLLALFVLMKKSFRKVAGLIVIVAGLYLILLVVGQALGR